MPTQCFMLRESGRVQVSLRRFTFGDGVCPRGSGYGHDASTVIGIIDAPLDAILDCSSSHPHEDSRWPIHCASCDYVFQDSDEWQKNQHRLYTSNDGSIECTLDTRPVGSFISATWLWEMDSKIMSDEYIRERKHVRAPLILRTPGGDWCIDQRSTTGRGWHITGEAPYITTTPSIDTGRYHGFLQNGVLTDDINGRR